MLSGRYFGYLVCRTLQAQEAANSTQAIIFPRQSVGEDEQTHQMYLQSHHSFEPGVCAVRRAGQRCDDT